MIKDKLKVVVVGIMAYLAIKDLWLKFHQEYINLPEEEIDEKFNEYLGLLDGK